MHNVDDLLNTNLQNNSPDTQPLPEMAQKEIDPSKETTLIEKPTENLSYIEKFRKDKDEFLGSENKIVSETTQIPEENIETPKEPQENSQVNVDEYGNELEKSKTYTEEEVQAMIRKRLKQHHEERQQHVEQLSTQQQQAAKSFEHDPQSEESWEIQLENHIKNTVNKMKEEESALQWKAEENRRQAEFEENFTNGMQKYNDFHQVVSGKPITNGIMMAARSMKDPAAFVYAASKQHPQELERISKIQDPYMLAVEVGRLEERMKKARTVSAAPRPSARITGDVSTKNYDTLSIEDRIRMDAKRKFGRK